MSIIASIIQVQSQAPPSNNLPGGTADKLPAGQVADKIQIGSIFLDKNLELTAIVLFFASLALILLYGLVHHKNAGKFELRIFIITILIFGSLLVTAAGFVDAQLGPVIGFFGTIAGYILGRGDRPSDKPRSHLNRVSDESD